MEMFRRKVGHGQRNCVHFLLEDLYSNIDKFICVRLAFDAFLRCSVSMRDIMPTFPLLPLTTSKRASAHASMYVSLRLEKKGSREASNRARKRACMEKGSLQVERASEGESVGRGRVLTAQGIAGLRASD